MVWNFSSCSFVSIPARVLRVFQRLILSFCSVSCRVLFQEKCFHTRSMFLCVRVCVMFHFIRKRVFLVCFRRCLIDVWLFFQRWCSFQFLVSFFGLIIILCHLPVEGWRQWPSIAFCLLFSQCEWVKVNSVPYLYIVCFFISLSAFSPSVCECSITEILDMIRLFYHVMFFFFITCLFQKKIELQQSAKVVCYENVLSVKQK